MSNIFEISVSIAALMTVLQATPMHGVASWYGAAHQGKPMANGEPFDMNRLTCASWYYPLGAKLRVSFTGVTPIRSVVVTVTDRGPSTALIEQGRIIDLSKAAFRFLAPIGNGLIEVDVIQIR